MLFADGALNVIEAACHCGAVRIRAPRPEQLTECNCSLCSKLGTRFAYYGPDEVTVTGATISYVQGDRTLATHHCPTCGCTTHWTATDPALQRIGVNARLMSGIDDIPVRRFDGADTWTYLD